MISTTTLQPPTNGLYIVNSLHVSTVVEIIESIIAEIQVTKPSLCRTELFFKRRGIIDQVMVLTVEGVFVVAKIINTMETMSYEQTKLGVANARLANGEDNLFDEILLACCGKCNT